MDNALETPLAKKKDLYRNACKLYGKGPRLVWLYVLQARIHFCRFSLVVKGCRREIEIIYRVPSIPLRFRCAKLCESTVAFGTTDCNHLHEQSPPKNPSKQLIGQSLYVGRAYAQLLFS